MPGPPTSPLTPVRQVAVLRGHLAHRTAEVEEARAEVAAAREQIAALQAALKRDRRGLLRLLGRR